MTNVPELFGSLVFGDAAMRERLPKDTYKALRKTIQDGKPLDLEVANVVANAMKDWAIEKGVTHFTHWFQSTNKAETSQVKGSPTSRTGSSP